MTVAARQIEVTHAVVRWYLERYRGTAYDLGGPATFTNPAIVGRFAVSVSAFEQGTPAALLRVLIATTLFQRRQDQQVFRILRSFSRAEVKDLSDLRTLQEARAAVRCRMLRTSEQLHQGCDLAKRPGAMLGHCGVAPRTRCHLKRHTVLLKRYGHFGKVPTSAVLMLQEAGVRDLRALYVRACRDSSDPGMRAQWLEQALMRIWRVNRKIAAMYLSALSNPDLGPPRAPWADGLDWTRFVVIDSNTDLFLAAVGYRGAGTYDARLDFIRGLAERIDLTRLDQGLHSFNPRLVQQAMYIFMSRSNRRSAAIDCSHEEAACEACPANLALRCPMRQQRAG